MKEYEPVERVYGSESELAGILLLDEHKSIYNGLTPSKIKHGNFQRAVGKAIDGFHRTDVGDFFSIFQFLDVQLDLSTFAEGAYRVNDRDTILPNGGRMYIDSGDQLEVTTPEVRTPQEVVLYELAAEQLAVKTLRNIVGYSAAEGYRTNKRNFDYARNSFGAHESLRVRNKLASHPERFIKVLAAHNLTRTIYTGSGGMLLPLGNIYEPLFVTSPRIYLTSAIVNSSPYGDDKPLVYGTLKDDDSVYARYHNVSGDANNSPFAILLRHGMNSVVARMLEFGLDLEEIYINRPLTYCEPITTTLASGRMPILTMESGETATPVAHQRYIAERALSEADRIGLTAGEIAIANEVVAVCDDLERDIYSTADRVEWVARLNYLKRKFDTDDLTTVDNVEIIAADMQWDKIDGGRAAILREKGWGWRGFARPFGPLEIIKAMANAPTNTRAIQRVQVAKQVTRVMSSFPNYMQVIDKGGQMRSIWMHDPLDSDPIGLTPPPDIE